MRFSKLATAAVILLGLSGAANATEIKVLASGSLKLTLPRLLADFQKATGNTVAITYGPAGALTAMIRKGDAADVAIVSHAQLESLEKEGKVVAGSRVDVAGSALGVAIAKGAAKPDIGSVDAFKRVLLAAKAIGYRDPATGSLSGTYTAGLMEKLGIASEMKPKSRLDRSDGETPENVFRALTTGEIELQIGQISEIVIAPGVELAGPLPAAIQNVSWLAAGIVATSKTPDAGRAFIGFLSSAGSASAFKADGFQVSAQVSGPVSGKN